MTGYRWINSSHKHVFVVLSVFKLNRNPSFLFSPNDDNNRIKRQCRNIKFYLHLHCSYHEDDDDGVWRIIFKVNFVNIFRILNENKTKQKKNQSRNIYTVRCVV